MLRRSGRWWYAGDVSLSGRSLWRALACLALPALGCAASEEDVQRRFTDYVNGANACTAVSECAIVSPGCPLGCAVGVRTERVADVQAKARELIKEYERGGRRCDYGGCRVHEALVCMANRCTVLYDLPDGGASDLSGR